MEIHGQMSVTRSALNERRDQAEAFGEAETSGSGSTGVPGAGPVSNAFYAERGKYAQAADLLDTSLSKADAHVERLDALIGEMREMQVDTELSRGERTARLKALSGHVIGEMRALLALDPARSIAAAAAVVVTGVPEPSRANDSSRARIGDIRAEMETYAAALTLEAERIADLTPAIPEQRTLSPTERLIENMWRMPGLTMAALLRDLCGWIAIGFRVAIYDALKSRTETENARPEPQFIMLEDFKRVEHFLDRAEESRRLIEDLRPPAKRGRPPVSEKPRKGETNDEQSRDPTDGLADCRSKRDLWGDDHRLCRWRCRNP